MTIQEEPQNLLTLSSMRALASIREGKLRLDSLDDLRPVTEITLAQEYGPIFQTVAPASGSRVAVSTRSKAILAGKAEPHLKLLPIANETSQGQYPPILSFLSDEVTLVGIDTIPELRVRAWNSENQQPAFAYSLSNIVPNRLAFDTCNDTMWTVTGSRLLQIQLRTGDILSKHPIPGRDVGCIAVSNDGQMLAVAYGDRRIELVNAHSNKLQSTIFGHVGTVEKLLFTNEGKTLIALDAGHNLRFWNVRTGTELLSWHVPVKAFDLSSDNQTFTIHYEDQFERFDLTSRE
ncbi:WD40 repeat domain-containing protein [Schlesneria sp. T3-172]|uniref:WD40 repeat domain-containing protein n=1 Tax=Schlesneria sphaerica TaxID=3373610 RepID=UPI0037C78B76